MVESLLRFLDVLCQTNNAMMLSLSNLFSLFVSIIEIDASDRQDQEPQNIEIRRPRYLDLRLREPFRHMRDDTWFRDERVIDEVRLDLYHLHRDHCKT